MARLLGRAVSISPAANEMAPVQKERKSTVWVSSIAEFRNMGEVFSITVVTADLV